MIIYNSEIKGSELKTVSSTFDLVPTIANLFDLDYDPRYYMGDDLFSEDYQSLVVFYDYSWKNEYAYFNTLVPSIRP